MQSTLRSFVILALVAAGALADSATPLRVRVDVLPRVPDGSPLHAIVTVTNMSNASVHAAQPELGVTLFPQISSLEDFGTGKCLSRISASRSRLVAAPAPIEPGAVLTASIDLLADYPFGVRPGRYQLVVDYGTRPDTAASAPVEFVIEPLPTGEYLSFLEICRDLQDRSDPGSAGRALRFVRAHPDFVFADPLLDLARNQAKGEVRVDLNREIVQRSASPLAIERAEDDIRRMAERSDDLAAYAAYVELFRAQLRDPKNAAVVREFRQLGAITDSTGFERHERFLRQHPDSFFVSEVLHSMVDAVLHGIVPREELLADSDRLLVEYYGRLLRADERSYWVRRAQNDPAVRRLMSRGARE
jgi:hypothetical protein